MNGLYIIPILASLILIHEIGHYVTARMVGVKVEEFGIGIPPRLFGWTRKGVIWSINAIPFGGFVRVKGEDGANMEPDSMNAKGPWQRAYFLVAGSFMNLLLAVVLIVLLIGVRGVTTENVYVDYIEPNSPAAAANWESGDRIVAVEGDRIDSQSELQDVTRESSGEPMSVVLSRGGALVETEVIPRTDPPEGQGAIGIRLAGGAAPESSVPDATVSVEGVLPNSAAASAGLQDGDEFVSINGVPISDRYAARNTLRAAQATTIPAEIEGPDGQIRAIDLAVPLIGLEVSEVEFGSPSGEAGWLPDDRLLRINGQPLTTGADLVDGVRVAAGAPITLTLRRDGQEIDTTLAADSVGPESTYGDAAEAIGADLRSVDTFEAIGFEEEISPLFADVPASEVLPRGFQEAYETTINMLQGIWTLITDSSQWNQIAGPIGMGQITSEALEQSPLPTWVTLTRISIVLSLNLAVLNLIPLPALDGGRLLFVVIELLRGGRRVAPEKEGLVHLVGFVLLLGLMFVIAFVDIDRIRDGRDFLP